MEYLAICNATHNAVCKCKAGYECRTKACVQCLPKPSTTTTTTLTPPTLRSTGRTLPVSTSKHHICVIAFGRKKITWENTKLRSQILSPTVFDLFGFFECVRFEKKQTKNICAFNHIWEAVSGPPCITQVTGDQAGIVSKQKIEMKLKDRLKHQLRPFLKVSMWHCSKTLLLSSHTAADLGLYSRKKYRFSDLIAFEFSFGETLCLLLLLQSTHWSRPAQQQASRKVKWAINHFCADWQIVVYLRFLLSFFCWWWES